VSGPGRLIAIEGIDGSGKSTQARLLAEAVGALLTHEPGATALGRALRALLLDPAGVQLSARAEALMVAADRAQHVSEVIAPALEDGRWVVTDRFSASTLAYQGHGRGLALGELDRLVTWAASGIEPDLTVLVDLAPALAAARRGAVPDRLEGLDDGFHHRVRQGYLSMAQSAPTRWVVVDGSRPVRDVADAVHRLVTERLGSPSGARP
jgi:dTMP kinase